MSGYTVFYMHHTEDYPGTFRISNSFQITLLDQQKSFQVFGNTMPTVKLQYSQRTLIGAPFSDCRRGQDSWINEKTSWIKYAFMQEENELRVRTRLLLSSSCSSFSQRDKYQHYKKQKCVYEQLITKMVSKCGCFPGEFVKTGASFRESKIRSLANHTNEAKSWSRLGFEITLRRQPRLHSNRGDRSAFVLKLTDYFRTSSTHDVRKLSGNSCNCI